MDSMTYLMNLLQRKAPLLSFSSAYLTLRDIFYCSLVGWQQSIPQHRNKKKKAAVAICKVVEWGVIIMAKISEQAQVAPINGSQLNSALKCLEPSPSFSLPLFPQKNGYFLLRKVLRLQQCESLQV